MKYKDNENVFADEYETLSKKARKQAQTNIQTVTVIKEEPPKPKIILPEDFQCRKIKGNIINLGKVQEIKKVEIMRGNRNSFGIEFVFNAVKGISRIAWFNQNQNERDRVYSQELQLWNFSRQNL